MIDFFYNWIQGIIIAVIISTIIEIIVPNGNNKKYIKTIIGIYILFTIITPVISKFSKKEFNINEIVDDSLKHSKIENNETTNQNNSYIKELYVQNIKNDITTKLKNKGYQVNYITIEITGEEEYSINSINLVINKQEENIKRIEDVQIEVSNNTIEENNINEKDIETIKNYICSTYDIKEKNIFIN